ncbi:MAG: bifunctional diaminohydroxyphosphoribosylaminopyrimidine deaminase/5-amino-6-(5-phosphoribosylamino)uracil reductase RibD [Acidimicrobiia bacterium]|nr:bifunctional diaminohydroxyphosphoribosylaminopyrimidine deaminase/5-amino-6-(5-phosphoribosylamino)uracil reductase RibD [Acidimicrobiia bacterium]
MTPGVSTDADAWMHRAIGLSAATLPHPNPRVGAVVLDAAGSEIGAGAHRAAGEHHAEVVALEAAGSSASGGTMFVSLEPCDHHGLTPPCTSAIIEAGLSTVVVGALDPDPRVSGRGVDRLRGAGIEIIGPIAAAQVEAADPAYFHHRRTGRPLVTLKWAQTLDGQVAAADGSSRWISGTEARADVHRLRAANDVVVVGAGTIRADDPGLDVRLDGYTGNQPTPVVVAGAEPLPGDAAVWNRSPIVYSATPIDIPAGELVVVDGDSGVDLQAALKDLESRGHIGVLVEGGPTLAGSLWAAGLVDRVVVYVGGRIGGGLGKHPLAGDFATMADIDDVTVSAVELLGNTVKIMGER